MTLSKERRKIIENELKKILDTIEKSSDDFGEVQYLLSVISPNDVPDAIKTMVDVDSDNAAFMLHGLFHTFIKNGGGKEGAFFVFKQLEHILANEEMPEFFRKLDNRKVH